jgi:hypothetical protein
LRGFYQYFLLIENNQTGTGESTPAPVKVFHFIAVGFSGLALDLSHHKGLDNVARPTKSRFCGDPVIELKSPEVNSVDFKVSP